MGAVQAQCAGGQLWQHPVRPQLGKEEKKTK